MWASIEDVRARLTYEDIDSASHPSSSQIQGWLAEAEAQIIGVLRAAKLPVSYTDLQAVTILRAWAVTYAEGMVYKAWGSKSGGQELETGTALLTSFSESLDKLRTRAIQLGSELSSGGDVASAIQRVRSHITDNLTSSDPVSTPQFTVDDKF